MENSNLPPVVRQTDDDPRFSIIWLHGLGADGNDFVPVADELDLAAQAGIRFVFPHAPVRPITINGGMRMRGWYDIRAMDLERREDREGIEESVALTVELIEAEEQRVGAGRVVLAGFSQGGAIALYTALTSGRRLAGVVALSTYLPLMEDFADLEAKARGMETPFFLAHGVIDPVVPHARGQAARDVLADAGLDVTWRDYPIPHSVSPREIADIGDFLRPIVSA